MTAEELLKKILECFFVNGYGHLEWQYIEGTTLADALGADIEPEFYRYIDEEKRKEIQAVYIEPGA